MTFNVPSDAVLDIDSGARFRLSTAANLGPYDYIQLIPIENFEAELSNVSREAPDGEVEDYLVTVTQALDFGDLPDTGRAQAPATTRRCWPTTARATLLTGVTLGTARDTETDGQPNATATGDDIAGDTPDDEQGVTIPALTAGKTATVVVNSSGAGKLNAFFDWNNDGDFLRCRRSHHRVVGGCRQQQPERTGAGRRRH